MSTNERKSRKPATTSVPPELPSLEASWDDETVPRFDLDDPLNEFDRVTAIPDLPPELYAKKMMAGSENSRIPEPASEPPVLSVRPLETAQFTLETTPPMASRNPDSTAPQRAISAQNAPTARPAPAQRAPQINPNPNPAAVTARPPYTPSPTGLELADLSFDSISDLQAEPARPQTTSRDPRDPVLELELDGLAKGPISSARAASSEDDAAILEMKDRYAMGDFTGALVIAESILEANPADLDAPRYAQSCRDVLTQMYSARLGSLDQIVRVAVPNDQIRWLTLDHRAGFLLSLIDGGSTVDQILDISGMARLDALRIMYQLLDQRVISLGS
ncbi:MAG TPA: hypothetical protein VHV51_20755 [Polyangiaceae bacterium]|jgi:hypothetical protein|nr:hypothetical protein [Polyangiaceae bacterium]